MPIRGGRTYRQARATSVCLERSPETKPPTAYPSGLGLRGWVHTESVFIASEEKKGMPQTPERKREYMREYMRRRHGFRPGVSGKRDTKGDLVPTPLNPTTMSKKRLVEYLSYLGQRGRYLVPTENGYELGIGDGAEERLGALERRTARLLPRVAVAEERNTQLEGDLARMEAMLDSVLGKRAYSVEKAGI